MRFDSVIILDWISTIGLTWLLLFGEKSKRHPISKVLKRNFLGKANNIKASFFYQQQKWAFRLSEAAARPEVLYKKRCS